MFAVGVLAFIFVDVHGARVRDRRGRGRRLKDDTGSLGHAIGLAALLGGGFARRPGRPGDDRAAPALAAAAAADRRRRSGRARAPRSLVGAPRPAARARALRTGMTIAVAIGLHNFAEGLAIGVSASAGEISLATVLIVGFALHNATEGFGIVGPLGDVRPSWGWLGLVGLIGGAPDLPRLDARLQRHLRAAGARLLRGRRRRDPLRDRRGLERDAPLRSPRARALAAVGWASSSGSLTDLVVAYGGG